VVVLVYLFLLGFSGASGHLGSAPLVWVVVVFLGGLRLTFCVYLKSPKVIWVRAEIPNQIHTVI
jgi:hypothetical protein